MNNPLWWSKEFQEPPTFKEKFILSLHLIWTVVKEMKTIITVQSIHDGTKLKLTFTTEAQRDAWIEQNGHNYVLKSFKHSK